MCASCTPCTQGTRERRTQRALVTMAKAGLCPHRKYELALEVDAMGFRLGRGRAWLLVGSVPHVNDGAAPGVYKEVRLQERDRGIIITLPASYGCRPSRDGIDMPVVEVEVLPSRRMRHPEESLVHRSNQLTDPRDSNPRPHNLNSWKEFCPSEGSDKRTPGERRIRYDPLALRCLLPWLLVKATSFICEKAISGCLSTKRVCEVPVVISSAEAGAARSRNYHRRLLLQSDLGWKKKRMRQYGRAKLNQVMGKPFVIRTWQRAQRIGARPVVFWALPCFSFLASLLRLATCSSTRRLTSARCFALASSSSKCEVTG